MKNKEMRRVNPVSHVATAAVLLLLLLEAVFLTGLLEIKAETIGKYAPWGYETFVRLTGEHPASKPRAAVVEEAIPQKTTRIESTMAQVAGILNDEKPPVPKADKPLPVEEDQAVEELIKKVSKAEPEPPAVPEMPVAVVPVEEKTVEEMVEEQMEPLPEIPPEPQKPEMKTNEIPVKAEEDLPVG
ncbi:MAG: hypothetical protein K9M45_04195 [Kiritimatiellales bacterium]|nr:hypothetical protein [Kiritimatiellales bacterium]